MEYLAQGSIKGEEFLDQLSDYQLLRPIELVSGK
jgi:hypothetical protein